MTKGERIAKLTEITKKILFERRERAKELYRNDYSCHEISSIMGIPESTVRAWVNQ